MNFKKYIVSGCVALLGLGVTSCVGDLDLQPNDPNLVNPGTSNFDENSLAMCYSGLASSGISGPGSSYVDIDGLDAGSSAYLRLMFTLSEFCSDEMIWIWPNDAGIGDIIASTWSDNNVIINGAYYRLMAHIGLCNQFLKNTAGNDSEEMIEYKAEARVLRAYSYYNMLDLFRMSSFITEDAEAGALPEQVSPEFLFEWIEKELVDIVDNNLISSSPVYGRVGLDGAEALLARLYLNAEAFCGSPRWADCQMRCENIIARHQGGGYQGSGLAEHYLYLFARDNNEYMPGGANSAENEILFGVAFDSDFVQSYGGTSFIISGTISNTHYCPRQLYGCSAEWSCIRGRYQMAERFYGISDQDVRDDLWLRGVMPAGNDWPAEDYSDKFIDFTADWNTTGGNAIIKFTGRTPNAARDGGWDMWQKENGDWECGFPATTFASTDQPIIRLADIYLMYTECYINGKVGDAQKALDYMNLVRTRAHAPAFGVTDLNIKALMDERSREFYLESVRRTDLVRNKMFADPQQTIWQYKGNINNNEGTRISERNNRYPIPYTVRSAQPDFKQNPGY